MSEVTKVPLCQRLYFDGDYTGDRRGVLVKAMVNKTVVYKKEVYMRGVWIPLRPFFNSRVKLAERRANKILRAF